MEEEISYPFIGQGWKFPIEFSKGSSKIEMTDGVQKTIVSHGAEMLVGSDDIKSSLDVLFATKVGERVMRPDYGSELSHFLFMPINTSTKTYMETLIRNAILFHEPRIKTDVIEIIESPTELGRLDISITYTISVTNNRYNYVYPFYVNEGTNLER